MRQAETTETAGLVQSGFEAAQSAWRRNLEAGAEAARAFQAENAQFAGHLFDLNLQVARSFASPAADGDRLTAPFDLGASALALYLGYLGRSAALARQAVVLPWTEPKAKS